MKQVIVGQIKLHEVLTAVATLFTFLGLLSRSRRAGDQLGFQLEWALWLNCPISYSMEEIKDGHVKRTVEAWPQTWSMHHVPRGTMHGACSLEHGR